MSYKRADAVIVCPYFGEAEGKCIRCRGGLEVKCGTVNEFPTKAERLRYMATRCKSDFGACKLAVDISELYGYEIPKDRVCAARNE
jgi:hypothetical protein